MNREQLYDKTVELAKEQNVGEIDAITKGLDLMIKIMLSSETLEEVVSRIDNEAIFCTLWLQYTYFKDYKGSDTEKMFVDIAKRKGYILE